MDENTAHIVKVARPAFPRAVRRDRLFGALDAARSRPLTWITAPPGAGKTTLISNYLDHSDVPAIWYRIDERDTDPASFFHYMGWAAATAIPGTTPAVPQLTPAHIASLGSFAEHYFQRLFACLTRPALLVFDNYQDLPPDAPVHHMLARVFEHLPEDVNVVILSRSEPTAAYARLRSQGAVSFVDFEALKLTIEEAEQCVHALGYDDVTPQVLAQLHRQTGGWAAGLVLLTEHARTHGAPNARSRADAADVLFDYFAGEVLDRMAPEEQRCLIIGALLPSMEPGAVEELTGNATAPVLLHSLSCRNYFTSHHSKPKAAYQFHPLFRAFLLAKAEDHFPVPELIALENRGAELLGKTGDLEGAWDLLAKAGNWSALGRSLLEHARSLLAQGRIQTLYRRLARLPETALRADPWLLYWHGTCRMFTNPRQAYEDFAAALPQFRKDDNVSGLYLSWCGAVESLLLVFTDLPELDHWLDVFDDLCRSHPSLPDAEVEARVAYCATSAMVQQRPDHPRFREWLARAVKLLDSLADTNTRLKAAAELGVKCVFLGELTLALRFCEKARHLARLAEAAPLGKLMLTNLLAILGWVHASPEQCSEALREALRIQELLDSPNWAAYVLASAMYGSLMEGDMTAASTTLARLESLDAEGASIPPITRLHAISLQLYFSGNVSAALHPAENTLDLIVGRGNIMLEALFRVVAGQIQFELAHDDQAWRHLKAAHAIAARMGSDFLDDMCSLLEARMHLERDQREAGLVALRHSLQLNKRMGGPSYPYFTHEVLRRLYTVALREGIEVEHVRLMIKRRRLFPDDPPLEIEDWPWSFRVYTLGRFSISKDGTRLGLTRKEPRKPVELLKTLIALGGRDVSQQRLADALWPEAEGDAAQRTLKMTVHRLRKLLGNDEVLVAKDGRLTLDARLCWVDAWAFERALSGLTDAVTDGDHTDIRRRSDQMFALYQGAFLEREIDITAAAVLRERLRSRFLRHLEKLARFWERKGCWEDAIECYSRAIEVEPLAEDYYRNLMNSYAASGRRAEALAVYERCKRVLSASLGIAPEAATEALRGSIDPG